MNECKKKTNPEQFCSVVHLISGPEKCSQVAEIKFGRFHCAVLSAITDFVKRYDCYRLRNTFVYNGPHL